jgi:tRNA(fMet)-specific endonuclease VapC
MALYLLDTDHLSLIQRHDKKVSARFVQTPAEALCASIISYEEQFRGWMGLLKRVHSDDHLLLAYRSLRETHEFYCVLRVLDFDQKALAIYHGLRRLHRRAGTMDLRIAATALAADAILVTRNIQDFDVIENLKLDNWA